MNWGDLVADDFHSAVARAGGVCLLPLSCFERHAHHLPLATDQIINDELCRRAAALEPAIVAPDYCLTQILEARHCAGTIAIPPFLILQTLQALCDEFSRNGLKKIILVNGHGGNSHMLEFFLQCQLSAVRDYVVYLARPAALGDASDAAARQWESRVDGHAGERETSLMMAICPDAVRGEAIAPTDEGIPQGRLRQLAAAKLSTALRWYGDHPTHYCGEAQHASAQKGEALLEARVRALVLAIRAAKQDSVSAELQREYFAAAARPL